MNNPKYLRKEDTIRGPDGTKKYASINKAKKASRRIQIDEDGALGRGSLAVVDKFPKPEIES